MFFLVSDTTPHLYWIRGKRIHMQYGSSLAKKTHVRHWTRQLRVSHIMGAVVLNQIILAALRRKSTASGWWRYMAWKSTSGPVNPSWMILHVELLTTFNVKMEPVPSSEKELSIIEETILCSPHGRNHPIIP
jgi:hypothetical protein